MSHVSKILTWTKLKDEIKHAVWHVDDLFVFDRSMSYLQNYYVKNIEEISKNCNFLRFKGHQVIVVLIYYADLPSKFEIILHFYFHFIKW